MNKLSGAQLVQVVNCLRKLLNSHPNTVALSDKSTLNCPPNWM